MLQPRPGEVSEFQIAALNERLSEAINGIDLVRFPGRGTSIDLICGLFDAIQLLVLTGENLLKLAPFHQLTHRHSQRIARSLNHRIVCS